MKLPGARRFVWILGTLALATLAFLGGQRLMRTSLDPILPTDRSVLNPRVLALLDQKIAATAAAPHRGATHGDLGLAYEANSMWSEAVASYRQAVILDPGNVMWRYRLALSLEQSSDAEAALAVLDAAVRLDPAFKPAWQRRGRILVAVGNLEEAAESSRRLIALAPAATEGHAGLGEALLAQRDYVQAETALRRALEIQPHNLLARYHLGQVLRATGREEEARDELAIGEGAGNQLMQDECSPEIQLYARTTLALVKNAVGLKNAGRGALGIALLEDALQQEPDNTKLWSTLGSLLLEEGRLEQALPTLRRTVALDPTQDLGYTNLGNCLGRLGRFEEALAVHDETLARGFSQQAAHIGRGNALQALARFEEARAALAAAVAAGPDAGAARIALGRFELRQGQVEAGRREIEEAVRRDPTSLVTLLDAAEVWIDLNEPARARELLQRAEKLVPAGPQLHRLWNRLGPQ